jgi:hypothetical protein
MASGAAIIRKHPFIVGLDVLIFVFAVLELVETWWHVGLSLLLPETALQLVMIALRMLAVWHAARHL